MSERSGAAFVPLAMLEESAGDQYTFSAAQLTTQWTVAAPAEDATCRGLPG